METVNLCGMGLSVLKALSMGLTAGGFVDGWVPTYCCNGYLASWRVTINGIDRTMTRCPKKFEVKRRRHMAETPKQP